MSGRRFFRALGQRAASMGRPRWLVHVDCKTGSTPLWAALAWLGGFDDQRQWRKA